MKHYQHYIIVALSVILLSCNAQPNTVNIVPNSNTTCSDECWTLSQYANESSSTKKVTLNLLPGNHSLATKLRFKNIKSVTISANSTTNLTVTTVTCEKDAMFIFENITQKIIIKGITFLGCTNNVVTSAKNLTIEDSSLNGQNYNGLGLILTEVNVAIITRCHFTKLVGGALYIKDSQSSFTDSIFIHNSMKKGNTKYGAAITIESSTLATSGVFTITNNNAQIGAIFASDSELEISGNTDISNNTGGALTLYGSELNVKGVANFVFNTANRGGAISAREGSKISVKKNAALIIANNRANFSGGGIYVHQSEIVAKKKSTLRIDGNYAGDKGGGIYAASSIIVLVQVKVFDTANNRANLGGGMYLMLNSKISVKFKDNTQLLFTDNVATEKGGAFYISDNSDACAHDAFDKGEFSECFITVENIESINRPQIKFSNNTAEKAGNNIYGGLLDRCHIDTFADSNEIASLEHYNHSTISNLLSITNIQMQDFSEKAVVSSEPVRVCFCQDNKPNCNYQPHCEVTKGQKFTVSVAALDQVNNTLPDIHIHASVSDETQLGRGYSIQRTNSDASCTELKYIVYSSNENENLKLYAEGPCKDFGLSKVVVNISIAPCPIGFESAGTECVCNKFLDSYVTNCSIETQNLTRKGNAWFSIQDDRFVAHDHCPFDYCLNNTNSKDAVQVNLNDPNGSDALCAFNRTGKLCGSCKTNLSLTFGGSYCMQCSNQWLSLLIVFAIAGVALVVFLLVFNLTVEDGTINGLIFYSNIIGVNREAFFPCDEPNFSTIFIAWLNLDFGFKTCFYDGMDGYTKTWLQLAFPFYILFLVGMVIFAARYSNKFSNFINHYGKHFNRNPIALLATLILLSHSKFVRIFITAVSGTHLKYSDNSTELVWLFDGNVWLFNEMHAPLFVVALIIFVFCVLYMVLLLFWQWLKRSPTKWKLMKWTANDKVIAFMKFYTAPFNEKHQYWIGLLLLVRVVLYIVFAVNISGDHIINLKAIIIAIIFLFFFQCKAVAYTKNSVYTKWIPDMIENIFLLNLTTVTFLTFCLREDKRSPVTVTHISTAVALITFFGILIYHTHLYIYNFGQLKAKFLTLTLLEEILKKKKEIEEEERNSKDLTGNNDRNTIITQESPSQTEVDCRNLSFANTCTLNRSRTLRRKRSQDQTLSQNPYREIDNGYSLMESQQ